MSRFTPDLVRRSLPFIHNFNVAELKNLSLQPHKRKSQENLEVLRSGSSSENSDNNEAKGAEGEYSRGQLISVGPDAFKRVYELDDEQCILRRRVDDDGPFVQGSEVFDAMSVRPTWNVNWTKTSTPALSSKLPQGYHTIN